MAWRDWGNQPIKSTNHSDTNASTSELIAEIDSTRLAGALAAGSQVPYMVTWVVGCNASTTVGFALEHVLSTGLGSTAVRNATYVFTPAGQTAQFVMPYLLQNGDRLRVRTPDSVTGVISAEIIAEPMT